MFKKAPPSNKHRTCGAKNIKSAAALIQVNMVCIIIAGIIARAQNAIMLYFCERVCNRPLKQALYPNKLFDSCLLGSLAFQRRLNEAGVALVLEHHLSMKSCKFYSQERTDRSLIAINWPGQF